MAESTQGTVLKHCATVDGTYAKMCPIKDFPDLGGTPEMLDTTTLDDAIETSIPGIQQAGAMEFTANFVEADYDSVVATANTAGFYSLEFGSTGAVFKFAGQHTVYVIGAGVNAVKEMKIVIARSSAITKE